MVAPTYPGTNIALGKTGHGVVVPADRDQRRRSCRPYVDDGNYSTRWASDWSDPQWVQVDLGSAQTFNHVLLAWEDAYATSYQIQTSNDGTTWTHGVLHHQR